MLLAVKGQSTDQALAQLVEAPPASPMVCLQNGVENERRVLRHFTNTYGVCVLCPASQLRPGVVQLHSAPVSGLLDIGRFPCGMDDRGEPSPTPSPRHPSSPWPGPTSCAGSTASS